MRQFDLAQSRPRNTPNVLREIVKKLRKPLN